EATALGDPEMRYLPSGSPQSIRGLSYQSLLGYRAARVVSGNTVVAVAGDVRRGDVLPRSQRAFPGPPRGPPPRPPARPPQAAPNRVERTAGSEQANVAIAMRTPAARAPDRAAMVVLSAILGGGGKRLYEEIRDRRGLAYSTDASILQMTDTGVMVAQAGTDP